MPGGCKTLIFLPPFAEELNKSRRMLAQFGHALADRDIMLVLPDLSGTGDSEGHFSDATWERWKEDVETLWNDVRSREKGVIFLGGMRIGSLLAIDVARKLQNPPARLLFWQPIPSGKQMLTQFLRLRLASEIDKGVKQTTTALRKTLANGEHLEIAGYKLHPELAMKMDDLDLLSMIWPQMPGVFWLDLTLSVQSPLSPKIEKIHDALRRKGVSLEYKRLEGGSFWATQELLDVPDLITQSIQILMDCDK